MSSDKTQERHLLKLKKNPIIIYYFDPNRTVRLKAGVALSYLIDIHMRPDPLFNELANGIKNADEAAVRDTYLQVSFFFVFLWACDFGELCSEQIHSIETN